MFLPSQVLAGELFVFIVMLDMSSKKTSVNIIKYLALIYLQGIPFTQIELWICSCGCTKIFAMSSISVSTFI